MPDPKPVKKVVKKKPATKGNVYLKLDVTTNHCRRAITKLAESTERDNHLLASLLRDGAFAVNTDKITDLSNGTVSVVVE